MLFRLLFLLSFLGYTTGPDYREAEDDEPGGKAFGGVVFVFAVLGLIALAVLVFFAFSILSGNYDSDWLDPII